MANRSIKIREWSSRLERYRRSGSTLAQFCRDEQVSVASFYVSVHHGQVAGQPVELSARSRFCLAAMIRLARDTFLRSAL